MTDWFHELSQWFQERETLAAWIAGTSLFTLVASAIAVPIVVRRIPSDYFLEKGEETEELRKSHPFLRIFFLIFKQPIPFKISFLGSSAPL